MLRAAEVMTRDVFTLPATLSLEGAVWALMHRGVSGAPVRDRDGNLVGVVSEAELLEAGDRASGGALASTEVGDDDLRPDDDRSVGDVMTPALIAVGPDEPIDEVVALMVAHAMRRVLVLDDAGRLVGIITPIDVLRALSEGRLQPTRELGWLAEQFAPAP
jgi:CBS-domain-containing membrane protein